MNAAVSGRAVLDLIVANEALFLFNEPAHIYGFYQCCRLERTTAGTATGIELTRITHICFLTLLLIGGQFLEVIEDVHFNES